jgi:hypothetical protein
MATPEIWKVRHKIVEERENKGKNKRSLTSNRRSVTHTRRLGMEGSLR